MMDRHPKPLPADVREAAVELIAEATRQAIHRAASELVADAMEPATPVVMRNMLRERLFIVARWNDAATQLLEDLDKAVW